MLGPAFVDEFSTFFTFPDEKQGKTGLVSKSRACIKA
jgi:hypothetical protein